MSSSYPGPLRDEPLAIELHNTLYAAGGSDFDGLADACDAWLDGLADRLPAGSGAPPAPHELIALRHAVRSTLHAAVDGSPQDEAAVNVLNGASARAPSSPAARWRAGDVVPAIDRRDASRADIVIAALAADAIELITGPRRADLRACGAPGCVLMFLKDHPRREWCSNACGNRARQARHYQRARRA